MKLIALRNSELTKYEAAEAYKISAQTALILYAAILSINQIPKNRGTCNSCDLAKAKFKPIPTGLDDRQSMTKEELSMPLEWTELRKCA